MEVAENDKLSKHEFVFETAFSYEALIKPRERLKFYEKLQNLVKSLTNGGQLRPVILK